MDRHYSTLELAKDDETAQAPELAKHDGTARAPERDYDATAFELDPSALAPEVSKTPHVASSCVDCKVRLCLIQRQKCSTMVPCLRLTATRSLLKTAFMLPGPRANGHGL